MNVSLNLAQDFSNVELKSIPHEELTRRIGLQLGAIEDTTSFAEKYRGIVVAKVVSCEKHPNADKLSLCRVDDGGVSDVERDDDGYAQVVCGASNVREGLLVAWIPPGVAVPSSLSSEPFILEARELRGKVSNGMLASPKELDISDEHEGILEINPDEVGREPRPGEPIVDFYGLDDFVIDCENKMFTHRPDCFGNIGVAREIAGIFGLKYVSPEWYSQPPVFQDAKEISLNVQDDITDMVPRFMVVAMEGVQVGKSPVWLQSVLKRVGIKSVNNIVDVTNYVMHLTGQPLHAFDYDKIVERSNKPSLMPRMANKGEKLTLLGGKKVILTEDDIVIATDKEVVSVAGVMGGADTEVSETTKTIVIECANFDMYSVRRTSMRHGLFTDAVTRFNKGQSPLQNDRVLAFTMKLMGELTQATQASRVYDIANFDVAADNLTSVMTTATFINERLGTALSSTEIKKYLENVEFSVKQQGDSLTVTAPFWRMDIAIAEDIVEEVGRLYGYQNVPVVLPARAAEPVAKNALREFRQTLRDSLVSHGANEVLTYSFVHGDLQRSVGVSPDEWAYHVRNALSPDLQYYRTSVVPSLLAKVHGNIKADAGSDSNEFALFEFGKAHVKGHQEDDEPLPKQMHRLAFVIAADDKTAKEKGSAFYRAKRYLDVLTRGQASYVPLDTNEYPLTSPYQIGRSAVVSVGGQVLGVIGEFQPRVSRALKLPKHAAGFELDVQLLQSALQPVAYKQLSAFPSVSQDVTYETKTSVTWAELYDLLHAELAVAKAEHGYDYTTDTLGIFAPSDDKKRTSFRIQLTHYQKTLKTQEVSKLIDAISSVISDKLDAKRI